MYSWNSWPQRSFVLRAGSYRNRCIAGYELRFATRRNDVDAFLVLFSSDASITYWSCFVAFYFSNLEVKSKLLRSIENYGAQEDVLYR